MKDASKLFEMLREKWKALPDDEKKRYIDEEEKSSKRPELLGLSFLFDSFQQTAVKFALSARCLSFTTLSLLQNRVS